MEFFLILLVPCCFVAAYVGQSMKQFAVAQRALRLELRVKDLEDRMLKEDRRQAGKARWNRKETEEALLEQAAETLRLAQERPKDQDPWLGKAFG